MIKSQRWPWFHIKSHFSTGCSSKTTLTQSAPQNSHNKFQEVFTSQNKRRTIQDLSKLKCSSKLIRLFNDRMKRKSAVLVPLCYDVNNRPSILYNVRSLRMSKFPGAISFPGGAIDPEDNYDLTVTALRETHEELGISSDLIEIWTSVPYVPLATTVFGIVPVLGFMKEPVNPKELNVNLDEVQFAFTVPLEHFCNPDNWDATNYMSFSDWVPIYKNVNQFLDGRKEEVRLWGLTAIITHVVLQSLIPHEYRRLISLDKRVSKSNGNCISKSKM